MSEQDGVAADGPRDAIRDAATVIVARDTPDGPAVFLVRRHARSAFLPDLYVFPGGAVDEADRAVAVSRLAGSAGDVDPAFAVTAVRETFEEAGLLFADRAVNADDLATARRALLDGEIAFEDVLEEFGVAVDASQLRYFSRWVTPKAEFATRRFDARFFVARAPADQVAEADAIEVLDGRWLRPREALAARERGEIDAIFPTVKHLERIAPFPDVATLLAFARDKAIVTVSPEVQPGPLFVILPELENAW